MASTWYKVPHKNFLPNIIVDLTYHKSYLDLLDCGVSMCTSRSNMTGDGGVAHKGLFKILEDEL